MGPFVFGYGSLAAMPAITVSREPAAHGFVADLRGYARGWAVAMDNRVDLPGYKYYTDTAGRRPAVHVCFLDVAPADGGAVNGLCLPVDEAMLDALDDRERNYDRVDVSDHIDACGARVWAYVGSEAGRERFLTGVRAGDAVIAAGYRDAIGAGFAALGPGEAAACRPSLDTGPLPVLELVRHELAVDAERQPASA